MPSELMLVARGAAVDDDSLETHRPWRTSRSATQMLPREGLESRAGVEWMDDTLLGTERSLALHRRIVERQTLFAEASGREDSRRSSFRNRIEAAFEAEPFEDGMGHPIEGVIASALDSEGYGDALAWLEEVCTDPSSPTLAACVLICSSRHELLGGSDWQAQLIRRCLRSPDLELRDAAVQAAEAWSSPALARVLTDHRESHPWLAEYIDEILQDMSR